MAYEDLNTEERLEFHQAVINKHQQLRAELQAKQYSITPEEKEAREKIVLVQMDKAVNADSFKRAVQPEPTPTVEETQTILDKGEQV